MKTKKPVQKPEYIKLGNFDVYDNDAVVDRVILLADKVNEVIDCLEPKEVSDNFVTDQEGNIYKLHPGVKIIKEVSDTKYDLNDPRVRQDLEVKQARMIANTKSDTGCECHCHIANHDISKCYEDKTCQHCAPTKTSWEDRFKKRYEAVMLDGDELEEEETCMLNAKYVYDWVTEEIEDLLSSAKEEYKREIEETFKKQAPAYLKEIDERQIPEEVERDYRILSKFKNELLELLSKGDSK